jgi:hypothetical protein
MIYTDKKISWSLIIATKPQNEFLYVFRTTAMLLFCILQTFLLTNGYNPFVSSVSCLYPSAWLLGDPDRLW